MAPISGTCQPATTATTVASAMPTSDPGTALVKRGSRTNNHHDNQRQRHGVPIRRDWVGEVAQQLDEVVFGLGCCDAEEVVDLADRNDQRDAGGESGDHRRGMKAI